MARYAQIDGDLVVNLIRATPEFIAKQPGRWEPADDSDVGPGWTWVSGQSPTPPVVVTHPKELRPYDVLAAIPQQIRVKVRHALHGRAGFALSETELSTLEDFLELLNAGEHVAKDDANLSAGIAFLVTIGVMTQGESDTFFGDWPEE